MTNYFETDKNIEECSNYEKSQILRSLLEEGCVRLYGSSLEEERVTKKDKLNFLEFMLEETKFYEDIFFKELNEEYPSNKVEKACEYFLQLSKHKSLRYK